VEPIDQLPVAEDLFRSTPDGPALVGTRCTGCGTHYFPKSLSCRNPACHAKAVEEVTMGRRGRLYSYTVQAYRPPALFRMDDWAPYAIGLVELPEGLRVMGMLSGCALDELRIDTPVELVLRPLYQDADGRDVWTYTYAPTAQGASA
jgi:uncharacterized protein